MYGLPEANVVPDLLSEASLVEWGKKIIEGEQLRTTQGGIPIYNPTIARVKVHYDIFLESYERQKNYQALTNRSLDELASMRDRADELILANSHLIEYVSDEIDSLSDKLHLKFTSIVDSKLLQWTDSKVALVEFIYAIYAGKCFNNGNTSLKDIAFCCEVLFNIEVGDFYRIFLEIRNRKKNRTQFLDKLKDKIQKMMDELDR